MRCKIDLYTNEGWINMPRIIEAPYDFIFIIGARGTGKTYGALLYVYENGIPFLFMRRTQAQLDLINKQDFSPFKALNNDLGSKVVAKPVSKYSAAFYHGREDSEGRLIPQGQPIGYTAALNTISNLRGFDASQIQLMIYDEFIPEPHEKAIRGEGEALLNAYETVNRNRELNGEKPVKLVCMANSNRLDNPVFIQLGLVTEAQKMQSKDQDIYADDDRSILMVSLRESPISLKKQDTSLYKLRKGSGFSDMALYNRFTIEDEDLIGFRKLVEYIPILSVGEIRIYKHKTRAEYYCVLAGPMKRHYRGDPADLKRFKAEQWRIFKAYMDRRVFFRDAMTRALFIDYYS